MFENDFYFGIFFLVLGIAGARMGILAKFVNDAFWRPQL